MTKIILVRHGHVEGILPERFRGRADLPLTVEGRRQADATARRIHKSWTPTAVYTSPLSRARATAEAIGKPAGLSPTSHDGLMDIDYGSWQGLTPDQVKTRWPEALDTGIELRIGRHSRAARPFSRFSPGPSWRYGR